VHKQVIFQPSGRRGQIERGKNLLEVSRELGVDIESICGGKKTCGKCKVRVQEGFFERHGIESRYDHLTPLTEEEKKVLSPDEIAKGYRLACAAHIQGDLLIHVPEESRGGQQVVRKEVTLRKIALNPAVKTYHVRLEKPTLADPLSDYERLLKGLESQHRLHGLRAGRIFMARLPHVLREGNWEVTVAVWMGKELLGAVPGSSMKCFGLAVDIGTTTVAGYLCDLSNGDVAAVHSLMNPQVAYGEDVMSRVTYIMTADGGLSELHREIIGSLNQIVGSVCTKASIQPDDILEMCIVGNTVMHHILLNISPVGVGVSPFAPAVQSAIDLKAAELQIGINGAANVHVLPVEAGFVGADNVGVLIAEAPYDKDEMQLIIDIGTNGEILVGNRHKILAASCATGPALEGAHIKHGMRAAPGAIERVRIAPGGLDVEYRVIAGDNGEHARGICGSGIIDAIAEMFRAGIVEKSGRFNKSINSPRIVVDGKSREFVLVPKEKTSIGKNITITAGDVRAVQLAKGAIYAGSKILMKRLGIQSVDRVVLAGAFGSYIDRTCAMLMGMFPDCPIENVIAVGNAAGDGARMALLDIGKRKEAAEQACRVEYVELTLEKDFEREFVEAMHFPHMHDAFPNLKELLPTE